MRLLWGLAGNRVNVRGVVTSPLGVVFILGRQMSKGHLDPGGLGAAADWSPFLSSLGPSAPLLCPHLLSLIDSIRVLIWDRISPWSATVMLTMMTINPYNL